MYKLVRSCSYGFSSVLNSVHVVLYWTIGVKPFCLPHFVRTFDMTVSGKTFQNALHFNEFPLKENAPGENHCKSSQSRFSRSSFLLYTFNFQS